MMSTDLDLAAGVTATGRDFGHGTGAPALARRFARDFLADIGADRQSAQTAELLVSELVTNAVTHARTRAQLSVRVAGGIARIEVSDDGPGQPRQREPGIDGGYGLWLVDWLAQSWGVGDNSGQGKTVWFTLPLAAPA